MKILTVTPACSDQSPPEDLITIVDHGVEVGVEAGVEAEEDLQTLLVTSRGEEGDQQRGCRRR